MSNPKKHHWTPQSYLRGFTLPGTDDELIVYSKLGDKPRGSSPLKEGCKSYLYERELLGGTRDKFSVEKLLAPFDEDGARLMRRIKNGESLTPQMQWDLAVYIGMMVARNPLTMKNLEVVSEALYRDMMRKRDVDTLVGDLRRQKPELPKEVARAIAERITRMVETDALEVKVPKGYSIRFFGVAIRFAETLCQMKWHLLRCDGNGFYVTSDNPVFFGHYGPNQSGLFYGPLNHPDAVVTFPITRTVGLVAVRRAAGIIDRKATNNDINVINDHCIASASRWVYSPFRSRRIAQHVAARQGMNFSLTVDSPLTAEIVRARNDDLARQAEGHVPSHGDRHARGPGRRQDGAGRTG